MRKFWGCVKQQKHSLILLGGLTVVAVFVAFTGARVVALDESIERLVMTGLEPSTTIKSMKLSEDVKRPSGRITTITATQGASETQEAFLARFDAMVALAKASG